MSVYKLVKVNPTIPRFALLHAKACANGAMTKKWL